MVSDTRTFGCPFSDHNFVIIALSSNKIRKGAVTFESRFITNKKLEQINQQLALVPFSMINSLPDISDKFHFFTKLVLEIVDSIAPLKMRRARNHDLPWVDLEMRTRFKERDDFHAFASHFERSHPIWSHFREYSNFCKSLLRKKMVSYFKEKQSSNFMSVFVPLW